MPDSLGSPVSVGKLIAALIGELVLFIGWIAIDRLATEKRTTTIEQRVDAIYNQFPQLRAGEAKQDERLTAIEHELIKQGAERK